MIPSTYHAHTLFCDGKNSPEEMVQQAIRLGCPEIGLSGHSYVAFDEDFCMSKAGTKEYIAVIRALQEKYRGQIVIRLGLEQDYYSDPPENEFDYVIGSVHYLKKDGCYLPVDHSRERQIEAVRKHYGGDYYSFIEDYYEAVADVYRKTGCQIAGHFDLVTKFNREQDLFDPQHPRYQAAANKALDALLASPVTLEVNTGGIARGYTTKPYPAQDILTKWLSAGKPILYSSDCHDAEQLLFGYDLYEAHVRACSK